MKVVFLSPTGILGGAEACLLDLLASFRRPKRPGWSPRVLLGDDGPLRAAVSELGVPCDVLPMPARLAALGDAGLSLGARGGRALAAGGARAGGGGGDGHGICGGSVGRLRSRTRRTSSRLMA